MHTIQLYQVNQKKFIFDNASSQFLILLLMSVSFSGNNAYFRFAYLLDSGCVRPSRLWTVMHTICLWLVSWKKLLSNHRSSRIEFALYAFTFLSTNNTIAGFEFLQSYVSAVNRWAKALSSPRWTPLNRYARKLRSDGNFRVFLGVLKHVLQTIQRLSTTFICSTGPENVVRLPQRRSLNTLQGQVRCHVAIQSFYRKRVYFRLVLWKAVRSCPTCKVTSLHEAILYIIPRHYKNGRYGDPIKYWYAHIHVSMSRFALYPMNTSIDAYSLIRHMESFVTIKMH